MAQTQQVATLDSLNVKPRAGETVPRPPRIESIDFMRGLVLVIMALDHTRDFFTNLSFDPEELTHTWYALFFTRWITHFCAPLFFFLAGTGAFFYELHRGPKDVRRFLWTRGLWLILLEFTVVGTAWTFKFPWGFFGVIWALGASMLALSVIVRMSVRWIAGLSITVIVLHDLLDKVRPAPTSFFPSLWNILHVKGEIHIFGSSEYVLFPLVPLFAVMAVGYAFGALLQRNDRRVWMLRLGLIMTVGFTLLRLTNLYGNPPALPGGVTAGDFHLQGTFEKTVISFLDTEKYPPSLQYLLMTLGPSFLWLSALDGRKLSGGFGKAFAAFGRVPMFFYILHLYLIHALAVFIALLAHQPYQWLLHGGFWFYDLPPGYGYALPVIYFVWLSVVILLYVPCSWFGAIKQRRSDWWLSYL